MRSSLEKMLVVDSVELKSLLSQPLYAGLGVHDPTRVVQYCSQSAKAKSRRGGKEVLHTATNCIAEKE